MLNTATTTQAAGLTTLPFCSIEAVSEQVLLVCHQQGLLGNELFAIADKIGEFLSQAEPRMGKAKSRKR